MREAVVLVLLVVSLATHQASAQCQLQDKSVARCFPTGNLFYIEGGKRRWYTKEVYRSHGSPAWKFEDSGACPKLESCAFGVPMQYNGLGDDICGPAPKNTVELHGQPFVANDIVLKWQGEGTINWTCVDGHYRCAGFLANFVDLVTSEHAGYGYAFTGPDGTGFQAFVATTADNRTEIGQLFVNPAISFDLPGADPSKDVTWYRRPTINQTGIFVEEGQYLVVYLVREFTQGGQLPAGKDACTVGKDPPIAVPYTATYLFYSCGRCPVGACCGVPYPMPGAQQVQGTCR